MEPTGVLDPLYQQHLDMAMKLLVGQSMATGAFIALRATVLKASLGSVNWIKYATRGGFVTIVPPAGYLTIALWQDYLRALDGIQ